MYIENWILEKLALTCYVQWKKNMGNLTKLTLNFRSSITPTQPPTIRIFVICGKKISLSRFRIYKRISTPHPCKNYASCHKSILFVFLMRTVPNVTDIMECHFNINTIRSRIFCNYLYIYLDLSSLLYISMKIQQFLQ